MPPPPPPSKSYLLTFDDLSDSDNDDFCNRNVAAFAIKSTSSAETKSSDCKVDEVVLNCKVSDNQLVSDPFEALTTRIDNSVEIEPESVKEKPGILFTQNEIHSVENDGPPTEENTVMDTCQPWNKMFNIVSDDNANTHSEDDEEDECETTQLIISTKRRRKKKGTKNKKKGKGNKNHKPTLSSDSSPASKRVVTRKNVAFGNVQVIEFERCLGSDVVPGDGGWPLGMSNAIYSIADQLKSVTIEKRMENKTSKGSSGMGYEMTLADHEEERQNRLLERYAVLRSGKNAEVPEMKHPLETRQWDYKRKCKNPLFQMLSEKERMLLLISHSSSDLSVEDSPNVPDMKPQASRRARSGSLSETGAVSSASKSTKIGKTGRARSSSTTDKSSSSEVYNEKYTQMEVLAVRNELERIRNSRSGEGALGCTCRKLQVYLIPDDGTGGKKANSRRMKLQQVKIELRKRHKLPDDPKSREELERLLHETVENEPCCSGDDCPCLHNGIACQADTCSCWYSTHQTTDFQKKKLKNEQEDSLISVAELQARCGNKYGMYAVDTTAIQAWRKSYTYCHPICSIKP